MSRCVYWDAAGLPGNKRLLLLLLLLLLIEFLPCRQRGSAARQT